MSRNRHRSSLLNRKLRKFRFYQILQKDRLFAYAFVGLALLSVAIGLAVPRFWLTTPTRPDFLLPPIKVSAIDLVQAWSLTRTAHRAAQAGNHEAALYAWRAAAANNLGDPRVHRGTLESLRDIPSILPENHQLVANAVGWLTALSATNSDDAILIASVLERYGAPEKALENLRRFPEGSADAVDQVRARCLLVSERYDDFARLWQTNATAWSAETNRMLLYRDAWLMVTDERSEGLEAALRLKAALRRPGEEGLTAARLLQQAAWRRGLPDDLALAIRRLEEGGSRVTAWYGRLWRLLYASGRESEAQALAKAFDQPLRDPNAAADYVEGLRALNLRTNAIDFLERNIGGYGIATVVWRPYFDLLVDSRNWDELRRVSAAARAICGRQDPLFAEALYADFLGALAQDRQREAQDTLKQLIALDFTELSTVTRIAAGLRTRGRAAEALTLLKAREKSQATSEAFWNEYFQTGYTLKDVSLLRRAVEELLHLRPGSAVWRNNRAALLLITGDDPKEALQLTVEGLRRQPDSPVFQINHAIALIQNDRSGDAETLLGRIDPRRLGSPEVASNYHFALALVQAAAGRTNDARTTAARVNRDLLLPRQLERLDAAVPAPARPNPPTR